MNSLKTVVCILLALPVALLVEPGQAESNADKPKADVRGPIEELGDERYRVGNIVVDKAKRSFSVSGRILNLDTPLEYLAVKKDGAKGYESLLELDTSAFEFNLACILLGLDDKNSVKPRYQFDEREAKGQAVEITLSWGLGEEQRTVKAANALLSGEEAFDDHRWVYIGSVPSVPPMQSMPSESGGELMAEALGTLIGFVHDPSSVIEHQVGAGLGNYGLMTGNAALLPKLGVGAPVTLSVSVIAASADEPLDEADEQAQLSDN